MEPFFQKFAKLMLHPFKSRMFLLFNLPSAYFSGVRLRAVDESHSVVSVPYKWFSKNPFRSTYFACLSMAAEMSTGVLALGHIYKRVPPVSMLVVKTEAEYFKKATDRSTFICEEGIHIKQMIEECVATGESRTARVRSTGKNKSGEIVAEFYVTWSFKSKKQN